jgi:hypothetical protein
VSDVHRKEWSEINQYFNRYATSDKYVSDEVLGKAFREYVTESIHGGWDGFSTRDVTGIRRMLVDLILFQKNM